MFYKKAVFRNIATFTVIAILNLLLNRWLSLIIKITYIETFYIEIKKVYFSVQLSSIYKVYFRYDLFLFNGAIPPFFLSLPNINNLLDTSFLVKTLFSYR